MLTAYIDESNHDQKHFAVVAGFVGSAEQWEKCAEDWNVALGARSHLHMNKLRWKHEKSIAKLLNRLGPVPHDAGLTAIFSTVSVADIEDLMDGTHLQKAMKGYLICVLGLVNVLMQQLPEDETFKLVLENQPEYANAVIETHRGSNDKTPDGRKRWVSVEFLDKEDTVLTEPGDFLAYALLQKSRDPLSARARLCAPILENSRPAWGRDHHLPQNRESLRTFVRQMTVKHPNLMRSLSDS
jgi:hypothetical protein